MKNGYLKVVFLLGLLSGKQAVGQSLHSLDLLKTYLNAHTSTDTNYVIALNEPGNLTTRRKADYNQADLLLQVAEKLAIKLNFGRGIYRANTNMGSNYHLSNRPRQTLEALQKALDITETYKLGNRTVTNAMTNLGTAYHTLQRYEKSLDVLLRSLRMQEHVNVQPRNEETVNGIGLALKEMNRPQEAIRYFQKALALKKALNNPYGMAICEQNIGRCYDDLGQEAKALRYYQAVLPHAQEAGSDKSGMATDYFNLGQVYEELKAYKQAELYIKKALMLAHELDNKDKISIYTQGLTDLYGGMKDFQQAYVFQLKRNQRIDSATTVRTNAEMQRMISQYETEKKQTQINLLRQQARLRDQQLASKQFQTKALLIGSALLLLLGAAVSAWLLNRARLRRLQEAHDLRKQIAHDLHDEVGSTLSSISLLSGLVNQLIAQNQPEFVERAIQKINADARQILEAIDEIIWTINPSNDSLHRIALRLQAYAQPLMESKNIRFALVADATLENLPVSMEIRRHLYLIGKEAINNLVKYSEASRATLRFEQQQEQLRVVIEDNGRGFDPSHPSQRMGQLSMQERARAMGGILAVKSTPGQGTLLQLLVSP